MAADLVFADKAEDLIRQLKDIIKRSYVLAITKISDPNRLGARPKERPEPGYDSGMYPDLQTLEEVAETTPDRTHTWVHESKFEDSRKEDLQRDCIKQRLHKTVTYDEALGQPPDYSQTMRMQQPTLQQTNQYRPGDPDTKSTALISIDSSCLVPDIRICINNIVP